MDRDCQALDELLRSVPATGLVQLANQFIDFLYPNSLKGERRSVGSHAEPPFVRLWEILNVGQAFNLAIGHI